MPADRELNAEYVRSILDYDPETGVLRWRARNIPGSWNAKWAGKIAGRSAFGRYTHIQIDGRMFKAHRLAWLWVHGVWPKAFIDHVNGIKSDNRLANLREATRSQNGCNRGRQSDNSSGHKGVYWMRACQKWAAQVKAGKISCYLGVFPTIDEAKAAYAKAANDLHGEFARTA